jgi:EF hand
MRALLPLLALSIFSVGAVADDREEDEDETARGTSATFEAMDKDSDQRLSQTEVAKDPMLSARFDSADVDGDGYLSKREWAASSRTESPDPQRDY